MIGQDGRPGYRKYAPAITRKSNVRPRPGTRDGDLYDRLWQLCKERKVVSFTYKGKGKWDVELEGFPRQNMSTQALENTLK